MCKGFLLFFWTVALWSSSVFAGHYASKTIIHGKRQLAYEINRVLQDYRQADVGIYVKSMKYGDTLYAHNVNRSFVPASIIKILTAESALLFLGPKYRFKTEIKTDAKSIHNGVLTGNLYLIQSGDPSLTYTDLNKLITLIRSQKIRSITGNVYIDDSAFDHAYDAPGWSAKDLRYCYGAPINAGIINHNCLALRVVPGRKPGQLAHIKTSPHYYYPAMQNKVITKSRRSKGCYLKLGSHANNALSIKGCMPKGNYTWGLNYVVEHVLAYNKSLVKTLFKRHGVHIRGQVRIAPKKTKQTLSPIANHQSQALQTIVTEMMKKSDNVIAGALFKKLGQRYTHKTGTWKNGALAVQHILAQKIGLNTAGMHIIDGSGLSPYNKITPAQMMKILSFAYHHAGTNYEFVSSLPIAGTDGTLKYRMHNIPRRVRAKTGSLRGVVSLAGYATSHNKEPLAFVIMVNARGSKWTYKTLEDRIATLLTEYQR